ncbi:MAG: GGDEF domain-containing protein [Clostridia bacterium]|nr:GGDEF domain-containing protein [Clostridia bacterium]
MLESLKEQLYIKKLDPEIERRIDLDNMRFCHMLSIIVMIFEAFMLIRYGYFGNQSDYWYAFRIWCYISYFSLSAIWFFLSTYAMNKVTSHNIFMTIGLIYIGASVIWGMLISAVDYSNGNQVFVFVTIVICVAGFGFLNPAVSTLFFTVIFAVFYSILFSIDGAATAILTNYVVLWLMIILSCIARYRTKVSDTIAHFEYEKINQKLERMSLYDDLTNAKNRRSLSLDSQAFVGKSLFLMLIDIDGFKEMNDSYGHDSGDCALKKFAQILQKYFFPQNVYRYGGDEFIVAVSDCPREVISEKIKHCQQDMSALRVGAMSSGITFSGGYLFGRMADIKEFETMLKSVDIALYRSKKNGKDQMTCANCEE